MTDDLLTGTRHRDLREFDDPPADALALLRAWLDEAVDGDVVLPQAMTLATLDEGGAPVTRTVAIKRWDGPGLVFGTNLLSRKATQLAHDARAAGTFHWPETMQQINVAGRVAPIDDDRSDELFLARPPAARASAIASQQSAPLEDETALAARAQAILDAGEVEVRPPTWGGYVLIPDRIEFWHGGRDRLHRRLEYTRDGADRWEPTRLQP